MSNDKKTPDKFPRTVVLPDGTVFKAYGVTTINNSFRLATTHKPAMPVDWAFWPASRRVTRDEAIALSIGLDPHSLYSNIDGRINPEFCPDNATAILFLKRLNLLTASNSRTNILLSEIAVWAVSISLSPIPPELAAMARKHVESVSAPALQNNVPVTPAKVGAGETVTRRTNEKKWNDEALRALWSESIQPGVKHDSLAKKHGVTRQRISALLIKAKEKFSASGKSKSLIPAVGRPVTFGR